MTKQDNKSDQLPQAPKATGVEFSTSRGGSDEATDLMKTVASKSFDKKKAEKVFTQTEVVEIMRRSKKYEEPMSKEELRKKYRKIKQHAYDMELGNNSRLIVFPTLVSGEEWYKVVEFSALYYVYRLAERMGRKAQIVKDSDRYIRCHYTASIVGIDKFVEQFEKLEGSRPEVTEEGIYIFNLKRPLSEDEIGDLKRVEDTRRERLHAIMKPKTMDPAMFQAILLIMRQVAPKVEKMHMQYYKTTGEQMVRDIEKLLAVYFDFAYGLCDRETAGKEVMRTINRLFAALTLLSETRVWRYDTAAKVGENLNEVRRIAEKNFEAKKK